MVIIKQFKSAQSLLLVMDCVSFPSCLFLRTETELPFRLFLYLKKNNSALLSRIIGADLRNVALTSIVFYCSCLGRREHSPLSTFYRNSASMSALRRSVRTSHAQGANGTRSSHHLPMLREEGYAFGFFFFNSD